MQNIQHGIIRQKTKVEVPMLITDKICLVTTSAVGSVLFWPYYLYNDINSFQLYLKTRHMSTEDATVYINNYRPYPDKKSLFDYLVM